MFGSQGKSPPQDVRNACGSKLSHCAVWPKAIGADDITAQNARERERERERERDELFDVRIRIPPEMENAISAAAQRPPTALPFPLPEMQRRKLPYYRRLTISRVFLSEFSREGVTQSKRSNGRDAHFATFQTETFPRAVWQPIPIGHRSFRPAAALLSRFRAVGGRVVEQVAACAA